MEAASISSTEVGPDAEREDGLKRAISRNMLLLFVVGDVLGAGIYALVGEIGGRVGGAIWAAFLLAIILAFFTAVAYAELVTKYPQAAGAALYVNKAFGIRFLTFMVAFAVMCSGPDLGGDAVAGVRRRLPVRVRHAADRARRAALFLLAVAAINSRGIGESVKINVGFTLIELTGLLLVVVIGAAAVFAGDGDTDAGRAFDIKEGEALLPAVMAGAGLAFYALIGFEDSVNVAEEAHEPHANYPRALFGGLLDRRRDLPGGQHRRAHGRADGDAGGSDGPLLEVVQLGPLAMNTQIFSAIALFARRQRRADQHDHGLAAALRHVDPGHRPAGVFSKVMPGRRTPLVAIVFTTAPGDDPRLDRRPRHAGRHDRPAAADRLRARERQRAGAAPRPRRPRPLPRADVAAGHRRRDLDRRDVHQGGRDLPARRRCCCSSASSSGC